MDTTDYSNHKKNKHVEISPTPTILLPKAQSSLQNKGMGNIYAYHLVKCTPIAQPETHTGHDVCVPSCRETWTHHAYCRKEHDPTVCENNVGGIHELRMYSIVSLNIQPNTNNQLYYLVEKEQHCNGYLL